LTKKSSYQKLYFRNLNHPIGRASVVSRRQESRTAVASMNRSSTEQARDDRRSRPVVFTYPCFSEFWNNRSHIFDGVTLTSETAAFQLCDITDPMLKQMIEEEEDVRDSCSVGIFWLIYPSSLTRSL
jgi:general transcription factor 3C polypeptide 5 (transcription factor C subunit 1)